MTLEELIQLNGPALEGYLWQRLRNEVLDPPLALRFDTEPPERFIIAAEKAASGQRNARFRAALIGAMGANLRRLAQDAAARGLDMWQEPVADQQLASLAFLAASIQAAELVPDLFTMTYPWLSLWRQRPTEPTDGQMHFLRALTQLTREPGHAELWRELWDHGPTRTWSAAITGWANCVPDGAFRRLGELADRHDRLDLAATLWVLLRDPQRYQAFLDAAGRLNPAQRDTIRLALNRNRMEDLLPRFDAPAAL